MKTKHFARRIRFAPVALRATLFFSLLALVASLLPVKQAGAQQASSPLTEEQRILHVLNRLGYGPRAGDVERVRQMGLERYIELQLQPERIAENAELSARLQSLPALAMTTAQLYERYPQPAQLLRQMERRGQLPPELVAALRQMGEAGAPPAVMPQAVPGTNASESMAGMSGRGMTGPNAAPPGEGETEREHQRSRRLILEYMRQNNMRPPQFLTAELQASRILRAAYSERQLQEVMVDFWTNHFNVYANKGAVRWLLVSYDRDTIRPHALGNFRDLLRATAQSPAMLFYLDNFQSASPNAPARRRGFGPGAGQQRGMLPGRGGLRGAERSNAMPGSLPQQADRDMRPAAAMARPEQDSAPLPPQQRRQRGINENYARELMELHTLGVDGGYTQRDVQEVARAFTGWTIYAPRGAGGNAPALERLARRGRNSGVRLPSAPGQFFFNPLMHDDGEKVVLGQRIPAGGGMNDGVVVLDLLARHPATARFIASKLCRRFVADNPAPALVERVAAAFTRSDGDIRATLRAIFSAPEFFAPENYRAKIKTPFEVAVSAARALGAEADARPALHQWIARMGEPLYLYQAPTGYPDVAAAWVNQGALLERMNFALALAANRIMGARVDLARFGGAPVNGNAEEQARAVDQVVSLLLPGGVSPQTRAELIRQAREPLPAANQTAISGAAEQEMNNAPGREEMRLNPGGRRGLRRAGMMGASAPVANPQLARIVGLVLGTPEFQRQ